MSSRLASVGTRDGFLYLGAADIYKSSEKALAFHARQQRGEGDDPTDRTISAHTNDIGQTIRI